MKNKIFQGPSRERITNELREIPDKDISPKIFKYLLKNEEIEILKEIIENKKINELHFNSAYDQLPIVSKELIKGLADSFLKSEHIDDISVRFLGDCLSFGLLDTALQLIEEKRFNDIIRADRLFTKIIEKSEASKLDERLEKAVDHLDEMLVGPYTVDLLVEKGYYKDLMLLVKDGSISTSLVKKLKEKAQKNRKLRYYLNKTDIDF